jgi:hypothetical protein
MALDQAVRVTFSVVAVVPRGIVTPYLPKPALFLPSGG